MTQIYLGFKAFDVHELLCHGIAEAAGLYTAAGLSVTLVDTTFVPDGALPPNSFHTSCGAAMASFLSGKKRKVVFVACDRPMFWLYGRDGIDSIRQLSQARVATFPDVAPPASFLRKLLADAGIAPGLLPTRDDTARLALLMSGSVDAALLSSRYLPHDVQARGPGLLAFVGASLRLPSTGLAVSNELYVEQPQLVATLVNLYQQAMQVVFDDDQTLLRKVLVKTFEQDQQGLEQAVEVIRECYNPCGYSTESLLQSAIDSLAGSMGLTSRPAVELYEFKYVKSCN